SAAFALASPCSSIYDAVKLVGLRGIKNLLFSIGAVQSFAKVGGGKEDLWSHAYQVAFYSYNLARNFCSGNRNIIEDAYVCGLLHDMGKIIFETSHPDFINGVRKMSAEKNVSVDIFEKLVAGVNHAEIGARVAEKWNFPDIIVGAIRYHHAPDSAPEEVRQLVHVVYLADLMTHYQKQDVAFYQIDVDVLKEFKLTNESQFQKISKQLIDAFHKQEEA
ncbi:MAG: HDOD domain-containing protein, partial [Treponema sp.]|nr:HDOD domain-containing protein [Treponema sp.]